MRHFYHNLTNKKEKRLAVLNMRICNFFSFFLDLYGLGCVKNDARYFQQSLTYIKKK